MTLDSTAPYSREEERIDWLQEFERAWYPVLELKPWHKEKVKRYYAIQQKQEGRTIICQKCGKLCGFEGTQIHHPDHNDRNNVLSNLRVYCDACNEEEKKEWLRTLAKRRHVDRATLPTPKEKENTSIAESDQARLIKQAPLTTQLKIHYKQETLDYLIRYVKSSRLFDDAVADIEAITGCSHAKAIEYLDALSRSSFAPFRQWMPEAGQQWIAPREGSEAYKKALADYEERHKGALL